MRKFLLATTLLFLPVVANAVPVIQFAQTSGSNTITGTPNGTDTATTISGVGVAVNITQDLGGFLGAAFFNLSATSVDAAQAIGTAVLQHYAGSFKLTSNANGTGTNYLSGTFTDAALGSGPALALAAGSPPDVITFTSDQVPAVDLTSPTALAFSFTNVIPPVSIIGSTIASFGATVSGNASATPLAVPEPTSLAVMGIGLLGLTLIAKRRKA
jgi:hypothetical protein